MPKMTINVHIPVEYMKEGDVIVAFCPSFDIASQGCTKQEANKNLTEAVGLFFITAYEMGTLSQVLKELGFKPETPGQQVADNQCDHLDIPLPFISESELTKCHV